MASGAPELGIVFETEADFRREFDANLSNGGVFVATDRPFELREHVTLGIELAYCGGCLILEGEVVHQVPVELGAVGAQPGVALQLLLPATQIRTRLEALEGAFSPDFDPSQAPTVATEVEPGAERRDEPRGKARVPAYLVTSKGEEQRGHTRNLSESGLLFTITDEPPAIDEPVILRLRNPVTGESQEISGWIARHVENDAGRVAAVGVRFAPESERPIAATLFLRKLKACEHTRHLGGISGAIDELGLASLVQNLGQAAPQGTLTVACGAEEGTIVFEGGRMVSARLGPVSGVKALARLLAWDEGRFEFHARVDAGIGGGEDPVSMQAAMMEAMRQIDELARLDLRAVPATAVLGLSSGAPDVMSRDLDKLEEAVMDLCVGRTTTQRILDVIPEPDADIYKALLYLLDQQAVAVRPRG